MSVQTPYQLPQNDSLVNRAAWKWLKEAKEYPEPHSLHLLTLAFWGLENGAEGDWPRKEKHALEMQLGHLAGWKPQEVLRWIFGNPNGPGDRKEQEDSLLKLLKTTDNPYRAAAHVLNAIWSKQQSRVPALRQSSD